MKRLLLLIACIFFLQAITAQDIPVIKANSSKADIRVGDEFFAKGGWTLDPAKKPDVFSIGSKWHYDSKKVSFITDIDSISFNVAPGKKYDFIILLDGKTPCYTQIATLADPVFFNKKILIPILFAFGFILLALYFNRNKIDTIKFLQLGYVVTIAFWLMTFISGFIHGHYDHLKNVISELGGIGTASEMFTSSALLLISLLSIFFSVGFYRASKMKGLSVIPAILSFVMPITMAWAGIFTLGNEFHGLLGPLPFLIILASLLSYLLWPNNKALPGLKKLSLLGFFIMMLILLRFIKPFGYEYEGLIQRFFYLGWSTWTIGIATYLPKYLKRN